MQTLPNPQVHRRRFLKTVTAAGSLALTSKVTAQAPQGVEDLIWHDVEDWGVEGRGWEATETESYYDR